MALGRDVQTPVPPVGDTEDVVVRQYRYLLTTAPVDALEGIHVEVMGDLVEGDRSRLLRALSEAFATGRHVGVDETAKIAHLIAVGARRSPLAWLEGLGATFARRLATGVLDTEASFGRFNGYAAWDGESPEPVEGPGPNDGFDPDGLRYRLETTPRPYVRGGFGLGYP